MGKRFILAKVGSSIKRLNCLDLQKVYFIHKKKTPKLPKCMELEEIDDTRKCNSPTDT